MKKSILIFGISTLLLLGISACGNDDENSNASNNNGKETTEAQDQATQTKEEVKDLNLPKEGTVAVVNGENISREEFDSAFEQMKALYSQQGQAIDENDAATLNKVKQGALDQLINTKLVKQAAEKAGIEPTSEEIQAKWDSVKGQFKNDEDFQAALEKNNTTEDKLKEQITEQLKISKYITQNTKEVEISEDEIKDLYNQYKGDSKDFPKYDEIKDQIKQSIQHSKSQQQVQQLIEQLRNDSEINVMNS